MSSPTSTLTFWVHLGEHKSSPSKRAKTVMKELLEALEDSSQPLIVFLWLRALIQGAGKSIFTSSHKLRSYTQFPITIEEKILSHLLDRSGVHNDCNGDDPQVIQGSFSSPCPSLSNSLSDFGQVSLLHLSVLYHRHIFKCEIACGFLVTEPGMEHRWLQSCRS